MTLKSLQLRRGTAADHALFIGEEGEITYNSTNDSIHAHDGVTSGGFETARIDLNNVSDLVFYNKGVASGLLTYGDMPVYRTWALLNAATGAVNDMAIILTDTGTHTDPVVGGTVSNSGIFSYSASPAGWVRIANTSAADAAGFALVAEGWAEGTLPGGAGTKSAKGWAGEAEAAATEADAAVDRMFGFADVATGTAATAIGEKFRVASPSDGIADAEYLVEQAPNLYNPADAAMRQPGKYINGSSQPGGLGIDAAWGIIVLPVTAGLQYTISTNTARRLGLAFYTAPPAVGTYIPASYNGSTSNPLTVTAPAGATYIGINLWSNTITEPTQVQVEIGSEATDYQAFGTTETKVRADAIYPPISTTTAPGTATVYLASAGGRPAMSKAHCLARPSSVSLSRSRSKRTLRPCRCA